MTSKHKTRHSDPLEKSAPAEAPPRVPKPGWIRVKLGRGEAYEQTGMRIRSRNLHTVCEEALCPNRGHCWAHGRATVMILGDRCTRGCRFCNVTTRIAGPPDPDEPRRVAEAVRDSALREVVITSVTRDDLPDGGASLWAETIRRVHEQCPNVLVEVLIPDFGGIDSAFDTVAAERPEVLGHNLETVPRLYPEVRPQTDYDRSLSILRRSAEAGLISKTSLMLGLGETGEEILSVMKDARENGCRILYLGQYLQPSLGHWPVTRYLPPEEFEELGRRARVMGFEWVSSAPLVRSSFHEEGQSVLVRHLLSQHP